jgi:hypothetical protein
MASPKPTSSARPTSKAGHVDSALRRESHPDESVQAELDDNGDIIHIDPPAHRSSKIHGGGYDPPTEDLGPEGGNTDEKGGWVTERGYGTPILASDELKKHPEAEWRQPAVSPELERRHDNEYTVNEDGTPAYITKPRTHSSSSRNNNAQVQRTISSPAQYDRSGTPLEAHKEYEPLFPEEEEDAKKPMTHVDKLKRPNLARHHFPSQDVWEDTPGSLQLETTVETPQAPEEPETPGGAEVSAAQVFEKPETEERRKENITHEDQQSFLPEHTKRFAAENKHLRGVRSERPGVQRFPSQDIWEDAPDHGYLETTVSEPQSEDTNEYAPESPVVDKPTLPNRPAVPARPQKDISPVDKKAPIIPDRPKPQVPARPNKASTTSSENVPTVESRGENETPQLKAKPPVPARPGGSKIAALQAGFLKDLNSKLGLGPQAPKVKESEEKEEQPTQPTQPLSDARKGRAKGPQRRKPAASPAPAATASAETAATRVKMELAPVTAVWSLGEDGALDVPAADMAAKIQRTLAVPDELVQSASMKPVEETKAVEETKSLDETKIDSEPTATGLAKTSTEDSEPPSLETEQAVENAPEPIDIPGAFPEPDASGEAEVKDETDMLLTDKLDQPNKLDAAESTQHDEVDEKTTAVKENSA